jgi:hypothetical protein
MEEYFWVKLRSNRWIIAERRPFQRWFICGETCIQHHEVLPWWMNKSPNDIVEIGERIICPHGRGD